jgi:hypothetical protein
VPRLFEAAWFDMAQTGKHRHPGFTAAALAAVLLAAPAFGDGPQRDGVAAAFPDSHPARGTKPSLRGFLGRGAMQSSNPRPFGQQSAYEQSQWMFSEGAVAAGDSDGSARPGPAGGALRGSSAAPLLNTEFHGDDGDRPRTFTVPGGNLKIRAASGVRFEYSPTGMTSTSIAVTTNARRVGLALNLHW